MIQKKRYVYGDQLNFLKTNDYTTVTVQVPQSLGVADGFGRKFVPAGTIYPSNDAQALGIILNTVEVTNGDDIGALIVRGDILKDALPTAIQATAKTALEAKEFKFYPLNSDWMIGTSPISSEADLLGKSVSDLQDVRIYSDGTVEGTFKQVDGYTNFSSVAKEQSGYYFAFKVEPPKGLDTTNTVAKLCTQKGEEVKKVDMDKSDWTNVVWLGSKDMEHIDKKVYAEIDWKNDGNSIVLEFNFDNVTLEK